MPTATTNAFEALKVEETAASGGGGKACSICDETKVETAFSKKQWIAKAHSRKCTACVESGAVAPGATAGGNGAAAPSKAPAPWYDEDVDPEFACDGESPSMVFEQEYKHLLDMIDRGEFHPDDEIPSGLNQGTTLLQAAATKADVPLMKAVLRRGARVDLYRGGGNALQMLCGMMNISGQMCGTRSRIKAVEFLLSIGADPNATPDPARGDSSSGNASRPFLTMTPLHQAVLIPDTEIAKALCELLLQHKVCLHHVSLEGNMMILLLLLIQLINV